MQSCTGKTLSGMQSAWEPHHHINFIHLNLKGCKSRHMGRCNETEWTYNQFWSSELSSMSSRALTIICLENNMLWLHGNKDMRNDTFYKAKMKGHKTNGSRATSQFSSHFPVKTDKERQRILRQMKHYQMSLEYPKSLQWVNYTSPQ